LRRRYISASKVREDITKFIPRKALGLQKDKLRKHIELSAKEAFCNHVSNILTEKKKKNSFKDDDKDSKVTTLL